MKTSDKYTPPRIIGESGVFLETPVLTGSLVDAAVEIKSMGQDVENHNMADDSFNHNWD